ncbi:HAD hydrolase-like protein [Cellulomonas soli]|uniref:HAD hydrolase-like protein n=1 Tax=Cellulomonas soli TaxID=931535 RepID=UPI003F848E1F
MTVPPRPLVLLDLDGTLMDSAPGIVASAAHAYRALGLPVPDSATLRSFVGPPITDSFTSHGVPRARLHEAVTAYRSDYSAGRLFDAHVFPGLPQALTELRAAGCTLVVATSKPTAYARPVCDRFALTALVDAVQGAPLDESTSTKALVIAEALAGLGADRVPATDAIVMVGDRSHDVHGAAEHGIRTVGVSWGYAAPGELAAAGATAVVDDTASLVATVLGLLGPHRSRRADRR